MYTFSLMVHTSLSISQTSMLHRPSNEVCSASATTAAFGPHQESVSCQPSNSGRYSGPGVELAGGWVWLLVKSDLHLPRVRSVGKRSPTGEQDPNRTDAGAL